MVYEFWAKLLFWCKTSGVVYIFSVVCACSSEDCNGFVYGINNVPACDNCIVSRGPQGQ